MTNTKAIEKLYIRNLEESIIIHLAEIANIDLRKSMDIYYSSKLATAIENKLYGIENLSYKHLACDLFENEKELF